MPGGTIDQLIINSPYEEPTEYWSYVREMRSFRRKPGRRPAGYVTATPGAKSFDDPGIFRELPLVNQIRDRVKDWRVAGYPGITGVTKRLLEHWHDPEQREGRRFFFCQLEAIETLIWLTEAAPSERVGLTIPSDGGDFTRLCTKMATGSGKTIVRAMLIAWQILNKVAHPQDKRFSRHVFIVAPGLTVKSRLQVLLPARSYRQERVVALRRVINIWDPAARISPSCESPGTAAYLLCWPCFPFRADQASQPRPQRRRQTSSRRTSC